MGEAPNGRAGHGPHGACRVACARLFAGYLRYFPVRKWKKAISSRVGASMAGVPLETAYGFRMYTRFHDRTNRMAFQGKLGILPRFVQALPPGACFIDIGANLGAITLMAARPVGPTGRVLAFEPVAETYAALEQNIALNGFGNITTFQMAIAARPAVVQMTPPDPLHSGAAHVADLPAESVVGAAADVRAVPLADVPEVRGAVGRMPLYAKIDTEGYELEVLHGMRPLLEQRAIVSLVIEIDDSHLRRFGTSATAVYAELGAHGYRPRMHAQPSGRHYDEIFDRTDGIAGASGNISDR